MKMCASELHRTASSPDDYAELTSNPIDCTSQQTNIAALQARGVLVYTDCP